MYSRSKNAKDRILCCGSHFAILIRFSVRKIINFVPGICCVRTAIIFPCFVSSSTDIAQKSASFEALKNCGPTFDAEATSEIEEGDKSEKTPLIPSEKTPRIPLGETLLKHSEKTPLIPSGETMGRYTGKTCRLSFMLALTSTYFLVEIIVGYVTNSMALVADSFHMLSDVLALIIGLFSGNEPCLTSR